MIQINNDFATKALMSIDSEEHLTRKRPSSGYASLVGGRSDDTQRSAPLKRTRSRFASGSFDMGDFMKASQQVEESIAFPNIEWPSFDDDDSSSSDTDSAALSLSSSEHREAIEEDDDEEDFCQSRRKRQCRGLTRCGRSCNLSSLINVSCKSERRGSNGSLS